MKKPNWSRWTQQPQYIIMGLVVLMILWMVGSALVSGISNRLIGKLEVESTVKDVSFVSYGIVDPIEALLVPDVSGSAQSSMTSGERTGKNEQILHVSYEQQVDDEMRKEDKYFYAPIAGLISYDVDGYESVEDLQSLATLDMKHLYEQGQSKKKAEAPRRAEAGEAYAKVIDNLSSPRLIFPYYPDQNDVFKEVGDVFRIRFGDDRSSSVARVEDIVSIDQEKSLALARLGPMSDEFLQTRFVKCEPYRTEAALISLPKDALVYQEDDPGVYILRNQIVAWTAVTIEEESKDVVFIKSLPTGTTIITSPQRVEIGDYVS